MDKIRAQRQAALLAPSDADGGSGDLVSTVAALCVSLGIMSFILFLVNQKRVRRWAARVTR
jgi:hypothetical protein